MMRAAAWLWAHSRTQRSWSPQEAASSAVVIDRPAEANAL